LRERLSYCTSVKNESVGDALKLVFSVWMRAVKSPSGRRANVWFVFTLIEKLGGRR
jgi:hypothetical protein